MKKGEKKTPDIAYSPFQALDPNEKAFLRGVLVHPTFVKMLNLAQKFRPSSNCTGAGSKQRDAFSGERASARLAEMRGWDLYQAALFAVLSETAEKKVVIDADYPDAGMFDYKFGEIPSPEKK